MTNNNQTPAPTAAPQTDAEKLQAIRDDYDRTMRDPFKRALAEASSAPQADKNVTSISKCEPCKGTGHIETPASSGAQADAADDLKASVLRNEVAIILRCEDGRDAHQKADAVIAWIEKHRPATAAKGATRLGPLVGAGDGQTRIAVDRYQEGIGEGMKRERARWLANPNLQAETYASVSTTKGATPEGAAGEVLTGETYTVSKKLLETVWTALTHYSYPSTYMAPRIGGVLAGCPRGDIPTPRKLTEWAEHALREIRKEIPAQEGTATVPAPQAATAPPRVSEQAGTAVRALEHYADSYDMMTRTGSGTVDTASVAHDIRKNMVDAVRAALTQQAAPEAPLCQWPTCQPEEVQQQVARETFEVLYGGYAPPVAASEVQASEQQATDPMDWPLPCNVKVGGCTIRKGCKLRTLVTRMESLHRMAMKAMPEPTPEARALFDAMIRGEEDPAATTASARFHELKQRISEALGEGNSVTIHGRAPAPSREAATQAPSQIKSWRERCIEAGDAPIFNHHCRAYSDARDDEIADLRAVLTRVTHERDVLAEAIRDAAVKAGIARADADLTGPHLLMLCGDMAECIKAQPSADPSISQGEAHAATTTTTTRNDEAAEPVVASGGSDARADAVAVSADLAAGGELPQLPEPDAKFYELDDFGNTVGRNTDDYTEKRMREYGAACAAAARRAAGSNAGVAVDDPLSSEPLSREELQRALMEAQRNLTLTNGHLAAFQIERSAVVESIGTDSEFKRLLHAYITAKVEFSESAKGHFNELVAYIGSLLFCRAAPVGEAVRDDHTRTLVRFILENADKFQWSLQGLGMLRLYLTKDIRLHVWDLRYTFPGASPIHDHLQWGLASTVISGRITNYRFAESPVGDDYLYSTLKPGYGCYFKHDPLPIKLRRGQPETYSAGMTYSQRPEEIHWSVPDNGTITLMRKEPTADADSARVFWPAGEEWGSAEPRPATAEEVAAITQYALKVFAVPANPDEPAGEGSAK